MDPSEQKGWDRFLGKEVILDTATSLLYIGILRAVDEHFVELDAADVHDRIEGHSTNEKYVMDTRKTGVRANRRAVTVRKTMVVSLSLLADVISY